VADVDMKVGELASRTGLTVRTLHHYEEIGLLPAPRRTPSGHRVYGMAEVRRLQQIASLRQLGLTLQEIGACLDRPGYSLEEVLGLQVGRLREEIGRQTRLVERLEALRRRVGEGDALTVADVTASIEATLRFERYYTPEQLEALDRRGRALGEEGMLRAQEEWKAVFAGMAELRAKGSDPEGPEATALARKARALVEAFTGGDPGIRASLERMYREGAGAQAMRAGGMGVEPDLMDYYGRAMAALGKTEETT